jgi:hydrogenase maturation protease
MRVLVAGLGNVLKGDDGFGVRAVAAFSRIAPAEVTVIETGIGGIHLVQELMRGYDGLVLFDAVDRGLAPGQITVVEPVLPDLDSLTATERRDYFSETHYATPIRALTLAREVGVLPGIVRIVGCQAADAEGFGLGLHPAVEAALPRAAQIALELVSGLRQGAPAG